MNARGGARSRTDSLRLFAAAYPTAESAEAMLAGLRSLRLPRHRETPPEQIHLTLLFIGERSGKELGAVEESVDRACAGINRFSLRPERLISLPERGRARLVAAEAAAPPELLEIHRRLVARLARSPHRDSADRFRPHFTLCRFAHGERAGAIDEPLEAPGFTVEEVVLVRSVLRPNGAEHIPVRRFGLGA